MIRLLFKLTAFTAITIFLFRLIPADQRNSVIEKSKSIISRIVPESIQRKAEAFTLSPIERRAKIIAQLKDNIKELQDTVQDSGAASKEATKIKSAVLHEIKQTEEIVKELESANKDQTVVNKITAGTVNAIRTVIGLSKNTAEETSSNAPQPCPAPTR